MAGPRPRVHPVCILAADDRLCGSSSPPSASAVLSFPHPTFLSAATEAAKQGTPRTRRPTYDSRRKKRALYRPNGALPGGNVSGVFRQPLVGSPDDDFGGI